MEADNTSYNLTSIGHAIADCVSELGTWFPENKMNCLSGAIGVGISLVLFFLLLYLFQKKILKYINSRYVVEDPELHLTGFPLAFFFLLVGLSISVDLVRFPKQIDAFFDRIFIALFAFSLLAVFLNMSRGIIGVVALICKKKSENYPMRRLLLDLINSLVHLLLWVLMIFFVLQAVFGVDISHLLVGAGVAGMAIAFAAQNTIANIFGAFQILGTKLFKVGDRIKVNGADGMVERIGFRSVTIRAPEGRVIDIPNRIVADSQVENLSVRHFWREYFCFGLVYQTTPEQILLAKKILNDIGKDMAEVMVKEKPVACFFNQCNSYSLDIDCYVWFKGADIWKVRANRDKFNQEVFQRFTEAGLNFAYPTSTVFLEKNTTTQHEG